MEVDHAIIRACGRRMNALGLRCGDEISHVNGTAVCSSEQFRDIVCRIFNKSSGEGEKDLLSEPSSPHRSKLLLTARRERLMAFDSDQLSASNANVRCQDPLSETASTESNAGRSWKSMATSAAHHPHKSGLPGRALNQQKQDEFALHLSSLDDRRLHAEVDDRDSGAVGSKHKNGHAAVQGIPAIQEEASNWPCLVVCPDRQPYRINKFAFTLTVGLAEFFSGADEGKLVLGSPNTVICECGLRMQKLGLSRGDKISQLNGIVVQSPQHFRNLVCSLCDEFEDSGSTNLGTDAVPKSNFPQREVALLVLRESPIARVSHDRDPLAPVQSCSAGACGMGSISEARSTHGDACCSHRTSAVTTTLRPASSSSQHELQEFRDPLHVAGPVRALAPSRDVEAVTIGWASI